MFIPAAADKTACEEGDAMLAASFRSFFFRNQDQNYFYLSCVILNSCQNSSLMHGANCFNGIKRHTVSV